MRRKRSIPALIALLLPLGLAVGCLKVSFSRDAWQEPDRVMSSLGLRPGARVADLGAGKGYFTFRLSDAVGLEGQVYAVEVESELAESLEKRASERGRSNVAVILARYDDPMLPEDGVDVIFTCNTYHHIEDRVAYFARAARYLRPGGRVVIIDMLPSAWLQRISGHVSPPELIRREMRDAGYQLAHEFNFLREQSFLVFTRADR